MPAVSARLAETAKVELYRRGNLYHGGTTAILGTHDASIPIRFDGIRSRQLDLAKPPSGRECQAIVVRTSSSIEGMNDTTAATRPNSQALFATATEQAGYFTAAQARAAGYSWPLLSYHAKQGRFVRVARGLYRLRDYPSSPREELIAAWLRLAPDAAISHESALEVLDLSDIIPDSIHLTVPRARRKLARMPGVSTHTTTRPLDTGEVQMRDGVRVTSPARTIVDVADSGGAPEQVIAATRQAIERGLTTQARIRAAARSRGHRIRNLVETALSEPMP